MDNSIKALSEKTFWIASKNTWIDGLAIEQLQATADLPNMIKVVGMPDLHPGQGYPIGAAYLSHGLIYPVLIGSDIGCGMAFWQTDINLAKLSIDKLERRIGNIDQPDSRHNYNLGTIGGGNHFAELQKVSQVYNEQLFNHYQLNAKKLFLLVHSGSRGLGHAILQKQLARFGYQGLVENSPEALDYLAKHDNAVNFAILNRQIVAQRLMTNLNTQGHEVLNVCHNFLQKVTLAEQDYWLHRKGASSAMDEIVIVPGSRGDYSYLVKPIPSEDLLLSLAHGAGRKWRRADCKGKLENRYSVNDMMRTKLGSRVICADNSLIFEEAPQAYKSIDSVIESMQQANIITVIAQLTPILTYKTQGEN
ncbi:RNA ligase RtcB family protein [Gilliamella sp. wkB112]|uniref:RNA ligase RtcB family protein n=1 Tax=Gilliamella sp. wkB112 TaxID=3120257 RepID=UPI00080E8150|nr:RNA ligase RtcB family protein [Gilliamella apicola]OCG00817.1 RNA ligase RtcB family protein [Gilliamella apicola]